MVRAISPLLISFCHGAWIRRRPIFVRFDLVINHPILGIKSSAKSVSQNLWWGKNIDRRLTDGVKGQHWIPAPQRTETMRIVNFLEESRLQPQLTCQGCHVGSSARSFCASDVTIACLWAISFKGTSFCCYQGETCGKPGDMGRFNIHSTVLQPASKRCISTIQHHPTNHDDPWNDHVFGGWTGLNTRIPNRRALGHGDKSTNQMFFVDLVEWMEVVLGWTSDTLWILW